MTGVLILLIFWLGVPVLLWAASDRLAGLMAWNWRLNGWIWKKYDPFGDEEDKRRFSRWALRISALVWFGFVGVVVIASAV